MKRTSFVLSFFCIFLLSVNSTTNVNAQDFIPKGGGSFPFYEDWTASYLSNAHQNDLVWIIPSEQNQRFQPEGWDIAFNFEYDIVGIELSDSPMGMKVWSRALDEFTAKWPHIPVNSRCWFIGLDSGTKADVHKSFNPAQRVKIGLDILKSKPIPDEGQLTVESPPLGDFVVQLLTVFSEDLLPIPDRVDFKAKGQDYVLFEAAKAEQTGPGPWGVRIIPWFFLKEDLGGVYSLTVTTGTIRRALTVSDTSSSSRRRLWIGPEGALMGDWDGIGVPPLTKPEESPPGQAVSPHGKLATAWGKIKSG